MRKLFHDALLVAWIFRGVELITDRNEKYPQNKNNVNFGNYLIFFVENSNNWFFQHWKIYLRMLCEKLILFLT